MKIELLTVEEVARELKMAKGTIYNMLSRNSKQEFPLKPVRVGKLVRFNREDLYNYINHKRGY